MSCTCKHIPAASLLRPCLNTSTCVLQYKSKLTNLDKVAILSEALPYLQRFKDKTVVIKYGGAAMKDPSLKAGVISDIALLSCVGVRVVLVHGGGPEINLWLEKVGMKGVFKNGLRVTDGACKLCELFTP